MRQNFYITRGGGVCAQGCLPRGCLPRGCLPGGVYIPACNGADEPPWTEFLTHACENITFPQLLLRTVNIQSLVVSVSATDCHVQIE